MIQKALYQKTEKNQAHITNPPVVLKESKQAPGGCTHPFIESYWCSCSTRSDQEIRNS